MTRAPRRLGPRLGDLPRKYGLFVLWLVLVWVALWESISAAVILSGLVVAVVVLVLFPQPAPKALGALRPLKAARFAAYFFYKLIQANLVVAWEVITPKNRINQGVVKVPMSGVSDGVITLVANAISLTPGTLTVDVSRDPTVLYIHVLHLRSVEEVRRDVERLESLALQAFAPAKVEAPEPASDGSEGHKR
jgi:multicomponent Na+:H+ antiporter subunit E